MLVAIGRAVTCGGRESAEVRRGNLVAKLRRDPGGVNDSSRDRDDGDTERRSREDAEWSLASVRSRRFCGDEGSCRP
jgi:hypothetical protein